MIFKAISFDDIEFKFEENNIFLKRQKRNIHFHIFSLCFRTISYLYLL